MGIYINSITAYTLYKSETTKPYFIDKTMMLKELFPLVEEGSNYLCITRPRRFGKTVMANMIASFFSKGRDSDEIFRKLQIYQDKDYQKYINQYTVIHIMFNDLPRKCNSYEAYIGRIEDVLIKDLKKEYPDLLINTQEAIWDILLEVHAEKQEQKFIFVLDEWDFILHQNFVTEEDKAEYLLFLRNLLKDRPYVSLAYMTGILPIAKYSSGSELNMFAEFTITNEQRFSEYFGFTEREVDRLFERYLKSDIPKKRLTRDDLRVWYDGYHTCAGERLYNPRSIVLSLSNNNTGNYWTSSGPYDEIFYYIENNVADIRDDLVLMVSGMAVPAKIQEYAATSMNLQTRDEIFSAMVVYGFLTYENGRVMIPNKELMDKFSDVLRKEPSLGYVYRLAKESDRMLSATLAGDTDTMTEILELAHDTEVPLLSYNNETELTAVVNLVYLSARDNYRVEREDKAGIGYVDFIFYPIKDKNADCIILELKVDRTPEEAIQQIKDKRYALRFKEKLGEKTRYTGRILAVGISYDRQQKKHYCKIEVLNR
ncbi:MAG: ATP-binding protein [Clostridiales bacterium]|nr:ATP-binding protein [Clostridiales bacterium]MDY3747006.1 AAA family ATPase [Lachnospiraceae bacterium]